MIRQRREALQNPHTRSMLEFGNSIILIMFPNGINVEISGNGNNVTIKYPDGRIERMTRTEYEQKNIRGEWLNDELVRQYNGVPDNESKGLEEVHVRGGRTGEIAYMFDGLYIRNPIFGGIGAGTRLNLFAIKEFDFQPGGFNAEYGDAMSAVSNWHTMSGGKKYQFKYKYETSLVGAMLFDNEFDDLRGYDDYNIAFGGPVPFIKNLNFWVSSQITDKDSYRVLEFDDIIYQDNDPGNINNRSNLVAPWDTHSGLRGFGFSRTNDIFSKISWKIGQSFRMNATYWTASNHLKIFERQWMYWNQGQNEIFRDTERISINDEKVPFNGLT